MILRRYSKCPSKMMTFGGLNFRGVLFVRRRHELSQKDKKLIAWVLEHPNLPPESPHWNILPCDVLHGELLG